MDNITKAQNLIQDALLRNLKKPQIDLNGKEEYLVLISYTKGYIDGRKNEKPF